LKPRCRRLLIAVGLLGVVLTGTVAALTSERGQEVLGLAVQRGVQGILKPGWTLERPTLRFDHSGRVRLDHVVLTAPDGHGVITIRHLDAAITWSIWRPTDFDITQLNADGVDVALTLDETNTMDIVRAFSDPQPVTTEVSPPWGGLPVDLDLQAISLQDGRFRLYQRWEGKTSLLVELEDLRATGAVHLPERQAVISMRGVDLHGHMVKPGRTALSVTGDAELRHDDLRLDAVRVGLLQSAAIVDGSLGDLGGHPNMHGRITLETLDLVSVDTITRAGLAGRFAGSVNVDGPFSGIAVAADLQGIDGTAGRLSLGHGTFACLPAWHEADDPCGGPAGDDPVGRWVARLGVEHLQLEQILPKARGPLRLEGQIDARGHGLSWPDGFVIEDLHWVGEDLNLMDIPIRRLDARARLERGLLTLTDLDVTGVAGTARGGGTLDVLHGGLALDLYGPLDLGMLADMGVTDVTGRGTFTARVTGDVLAPGVPLDLNGSIELRPLRYADGVVIDRAWGTWSGTVKDGITSIRADVRATGAHTYGADTASLGVPNLTVRVDDRITVTGTVAAPRVVYGEAVYVDTVRAPFTFDRPRVGGEPHVTAQVVVGETRLRGLVGNHGAIDVDLLGNIALLDVDLRYDADPFVVIPDLRIDLSTTALSASSLIFGPTGRQRWEVVEPWRITVVEGGFADARLSAASSFGALHLDGTLRSAGRIDGQLVIEGLDLDTLAELAPDLFSDLDGVVDLTATWSGDARQPTLAVSGGVEQLYLAGVARWLDLRGRLDVADDVATVNLNAAIAGTHLLELTGFAPVVSDLAKPGLSDRGDADLAVTVLPGQLERFELLLPDTDLPDGRVSATLQVKGDLRDPDLLLGAVTELEVTGIAEHVRAELDLSRREGTLAATLDVYDGYRAIVLTNARARTRLAEVTHWLLAGGPKPDLSDYRVFADDIAGVATLRDLPVSTLQALAGTSYDLTGDLRGTLSATGSPSEPELATSLRFAGSAAGLPLEARVVLDREDDVPDGYTARVEVGPGEAPWVVVDGAIPMLPRTALSPTEWGTGDLDLAVKGAGVPLALARVALPDLEAATGKLQVAGKVTGSLAGPIPNIALFARDAGFTWRPLGLTARKVDVEARLTADEVGDLMFQLDALRAQTQPATLSLQSLSLGTPSRLTANGSVRLEGGVPTDVAGDLNLDALWLAATDDLQLRLTGDLRLSGRADDLDVRGRLAADQGYVVLQAADLLEQRVSQLDPHLVVHRAQQTSRTLTPDPPSWVDALDMAVDIDLGRSMRTRILMPFFDDLGAFGANVTRADVQARLGGDLQLAMRGGDLEIVGGVVLNEGELDVLRAHFDLAESSRITFLGADYANPQLEIRGVMPVGGGEINLDVGGTAAHPDVNFSSDDFSTNAELFTILLTGESPDDLSSAEGRLAFEAVSDLLVNSVLGGINLGSLSVEADGTLHIGIPLHRTVFVESTVTPVPELNENRITVVAEWSIIPRLLLTVAYGDRRMWGDIGWEVRF
jgi:hypothetical protein